MTGEVEAIVRAPLRGAHARAPSRRIFAFSFWLPPQVKPKALAGRERVVVYRQPVREQIVLAALQSYLARTDDPVPALHVREQAVARRLRAAPLARATLQTIYLRSDGALFAWDHDASPEQVRRLDPATVNLRRLLADGSRALPQLAPLLPERPSDASTCYRCEGVPTPLPYGLCLVCDGLGWTPPDDAG